jgi:hypothetical protein
VAKNGFSVALIVGAEMLEGHREHQDLAKRLQQKAAAYNAPTFELRSSEWQAHSGYRPGVWAHMTESILCEADAPSFVWEKFEPCFDYSDEADRVAARRYPEALSDRGWAAILEADTLKTSDSGWLREVLSEKPERLQQAENRKELVFRYAVRVRDGADKKWMRLSDWTRFVKKHCSSFDPRRSEWTALEIIRQLIEPTLEVGKSAALLDRPHPDNVFLPAVWAAERRKANDLSPYSWQEWRKLVAEHSGIQPSEGFKAVIDYRYRASETERSGAVAWDARLHGVGRLLLGLLRLDHSAPRLWNMRGNEYATAFPFGPIASALAISSPTLRILEGSLGVRSAETRAIQRQAPFFGWPEGEAPNDIDLDPPLFQEADDILYAIVEAQRILEENQIAVSRNQPRQLIPVNLMDVGAVRSDGEDDSDERGRMDGK